MGRSPCCAQEGLKKGPWTQEEDEKLIAFVTEHGHGNWRALPKKCGLLRCGKSCRLRWNNYLRPDIKRGLFTQSEEQKIIQLHALVGNKWAFIASQLPKRTDNEIKNYWNTVLRKRVEKVGLNSFMSFGAPRTDRTRTPAAEKQTQEYKGNNKNSNSASKESYNNSISVLSCTHLAQWESARLEAEMRLAKESQSSKNTHSLFPFAYKGHSFSVSNTTTTTTATSTGALSSFSNHIHTNHQSLPQPSTCLIPNTLPSSVSNPCLIQSRSAINPLSSASGLSLPAISSIPSRCSASSSASTSSNIPSSKLLSSLPSQESIGSALTLGPSGRLSWQTKELSFTSSPCTSHTPSQSSLISQMLCQSEGHHGQDGGSQALPEDAVDQLKAGREQLNLEARSSIMDLNSTMESSMHLNDSMENWHDLILDVENNSCSDVVSTNWKGALIPISAQREEFSHDTSSMVINTTKPCLQVPGSLDLEGLNLFQFDTLMSCEHLYANQHIIWDTPTTLSISSASIVN